MMAALGEAEQGEKRGEVPIGAIVVLDDVLIGRGCNSPIGLNDPTAHAEILALRTAARHIGNYRLVNATMYVTVEPCVMCMGALLHARLSRVVFGCFDEKFGAAGSLSDLSCDPRLNHRIEITSGILAEESKKLLRTFFWKKREAMKKNRETGE